MSTANDMYFIRIVTKCDGKESLFSAPGRLIPTEEGFTFSYETYGGPSDLELRGKRLFMTRRGTSGFSCCFEQGVSGAMTLSLGTSSADIPMRTKRLQILPSDDFFEAELEYDLSFDRTFTRFLLHLHIFIGGPMKITYYGHSCFALESGAGTRIVTDPYGEVGLKLPPLSADILTVSHGHYDHSNISAVDHTVLFDRTGEYEQGGVSLCAFRSAHDDRGGALRGENNIFRYEIDGIRVVHLGDSGVRAEELPKGLSPDILLIPVGGHYTIGAEEAVRYIDLLAPKIVIPMHYKVKGLTVDIEGVERFARLAAQKYLVESAGNVLEVTRDTLPQTTKIIVMERY